MKIVDTASPSATKVARTADGQVDHDAYKSVLAIYPIDGLDVNVKIVDARTRFGHLDLLVTPLHGAGERWVERKNLQIPSDPADAAPAVTPWGIAKESPAGAPTPSLEEQVLSIIQKTSVK